MEKYICIKCESSEIYYTPKIIWKKRFNKFDPKTVLMIGVYCCECNRFIKWVPQTVNLITELSQQLSEIKFFINNLKGEGSSHEY